MIKLNSSVGFPEGYILLIMMFIFPYLVARKNVIQVDEVIHYYMDISEKYIHRIIKMIVVSTYKGLLIR